MESVLKKIYHEELCAEMPTVNTPEYEKANADLIEMEHTIKEALNSENKELFYQYVNMMVNKHGLELEDFFMRGFKTGFNLALECMGIDFSQVKKTD